MIVATAQRERPTSTSVPLAARIAALDWDGHCG